MQKAQPKTAGFWGSPPPTPAISGALASVAGKAVKWGALGAGAVLTYRHFQKKDQAKMASLGSILAKIASASCKCPKCRKVVKGEGAIAGDVMGSSTIQEDMQSKMASSLLRIISTF